MSLLLGEILLSLGEIIMREKDYIFWGILPDDLAACCYVIWDGISDHPVYIGLTREGAESRIQGHRYGSRGVGPSMLGHVIARSEPYSWDWIVEVIIPENFGVVRLEKLERDLIRGLKPWLNRTYNEWDSRGVEKPWWHLT